MLVINQEKRRLIDLALSSSRKRLSSQTGFVHLCHEADGEKHDTIPLYENFCFALALFRSRLSEDVAEGKALLERLLSFEVDGNFPIYLHEFPTCRTRGIALDVLPFLIFIERDFQSVLGKALKEKLETTLIRMLDFLDKEHQKFPFTPYLWLKREALKEDFTPRAFVPHNSTELGSYLIALEIWGKYSEEDFMWILPYWHEDLCVYCGPQGKEFSFQGDLAPTLFDLFMMQWTGKFSERFRKDHPVLLQAALVAPFNCSCSGGPAKNVPYPIVQEKSPVFTLFWGTTNQPHSLTIQEGKTKAIAKKTSEGVVVEFRLPEELPEDGDARVELGFFLNLHPSHMITIEGERATTFQLGEKVTIATDDNEVLDLQFRLKEGEGTFYGHLSRSNRPRQLATKGEKRFEAYDIWISLRTIRRTPSCVIEVMLFPVESSTA